MGDDVGRDGRIEARYADWQADGEDGMTGTGAAVDRDERRSADVSMPGGYAGDVDPAKAWAILEHEADSVLVDVRSQPEWSFVGVPDLSRLGKKPVLIAWQTYPGMVPNAGFAADLKAAGVTRQQAVIFLCRSGGRSKAAAIAMTAAGYGRCYNLSGGFEGPPDAERHRGGREGWKVAGLPWIQE